MLAFDLDAAGAVFEINAGGGFIDLLATAAAALDEFFRQGFLGDAKICHPCFESGYFFRTWHGVLRLNTVDVFSHGSGDFASDVCALGGEGWHEPGIGAYYVCDDGDFSIACLFFVITFAANTDGGDG